MDRRTFIRTAAASAALLSAPRRARADFGPSRGLRKFVQPLPALGQMAPATKRPFGDPGVDYYEIAMREFSQQLHPDLPPTKLWGYCDKAGSAQAHLGSAVVARRGRPVRIRFSNELPQTHIFAGSVDNTVLGQHLHLAAHPNRACPHLHGGRVPWPSDGGPMYWFTPEPAMYGESAVPGGWLPDPSGAMTQDVWYPNTESARLMWFHDHAMGNTRLNAYAGLAAPYIVRDSAEDLLLKRGAIPEREVPLVFQDKVINDDGSLWYPDRYHEMFDEDGTAAPPYPSANPEFWGDTMLANGVVYPFLEVEPRRYRFRILNACNTRFLRLRLVAADPLYPTEPGPGPAIPVQLIGTEGGFLNPLLRPRGAMVTSMLMGPAERFDAVIDFSALAPGTTLIMANDAPVPFPGGDPPVTSAPGFGPDAVTVLQIRVVPLTGRRDPPPPRQWELPRVHMLSNGLLSDLRGAVVRGVTLNEGTDDYGRLMPLLGTTQPGRIELPFMAEPTETPRAGALEIWRIFNRTADAHPIHFHLTNAQILARHSFADGSFAATGPARAPEPWELGWKDTVLVYPGECTAVVMRFDLPPDPVVMVNGTMTPVTVPESPRTGGYEYVWHCHILEHEEHDMMRPLIVRP